MQKLNLIGIILVLAVVVSGSVAEAKKDPSPQLLIMSVNIDFDTSPCLLMIAGENFGDGTPTVMLNGKYLNVIYNTPNYLEAEFDCGIEDGEHRKLGCVIQLVRCRQFVVVHGRCSFVRMPRKPRAWCSVLPLEDR